MPGRETDRTPAGPNRREAPRRATARPAAGLPAAVGNRALGRMLARVEAEDAAKALAGALAPGVLGAGRQVLDTMTALSHDPAGFDATATAYAQQAKAPLPPALDAVPGAAGLVPDGWVPGSSKA